MIDYKKTNNIVGWAVFIFATAVYTITVEPTASFWDCAEFIASAYKLEIPHPSGAPLFLLLGRVFSFAALGNPETVAFWVNMLSVVSSALAVLFTFWTITLLGRKIMSVKKDEESFTQIITLMGAGIVGALAFTFSDSFWFSAVEAEVYAMSSFLTAVVVWAMLKWDVIEDPREENRWLILIAYIIGLSIGVHLLNIVSLPALALIYYFKKYQNHTPKGIILALMGGSVALMIIWQFVIIGLPSIAGHFEVFFVNSLNLPFGSGIIFFSVVFIGLLVFGIFFSRKKGKVNLNTALLSFAFIVMGYLSYGSMVIRSNYNPPIDQNNPENIMSLLSYLNREQYGSRPLLHGHYFTAEVLDQSRGKKVYSKGEEKYEVTDYKIITKHDPAHTTILPRMYSQAPGHPEEYRKWTGLKPNEKPSFIDNIGFMIRYQLGHMYFRYFMWNFAGRESDMDGASWLRPWETFKEVPEKIATNAGRNQFFMLPFLLGLLGLFFQYRKDRKGFLYILSLFVLMGVALVVYLNSPATEPRERDYIYAGSYYAFTFWIGFGVIWLAQALSKALNPRNAAIAATAICLVVPAIMGAEGWDDHDRSDRYFSVDAARNYLASCAPNAIVFTGGDNDTFPLWYMQEVEGFRTDVRVIVLSYFNTDWYIEQMTRKVYESEALPFSLEKKHFRQGHLNDYLPIMENPNVKDGVLPLNQFLRLIKNEHPALKVPTSVGSYNSVPAKTVSLNVDTSRVKELSFVPKNLEHLLTDKMVWSLQGRGIEKKDLMILDLIANNNWERPIYFNNTSLNSIKMNLKEYTIQEGLTYRLVPVKRPSANEELVNTAVMYDNLINNFAYRNLDNPSVYYNENYRNFVLNHRAAFNALAKGFIMEDNYEKAKEVIDFSLKTMPHESIPYDFMSVETLSILLELDEMEQAKQMAEVMWTMNRDMFIWLNENETEIGRERQISFTVMSQIAQLMRAAGLNEEASKYQNELRSIYERL